MLPHLTTTLLANLSRSGGPSLLTSAAAAAATALLGGSTGSGAGSRPHAHAAAACAAPRARGHGMMHTSAAPRGPQAGGYMCTGRGAFVGDPNPSTTKYLITGACGQIGAELVPFLRNK